MTSTRAQLIAYFLTGYKPTQAQFTDFINSVFNLEEDELAQSNITGLADALAAKASASSVTILQSAVSFFQGQPLAAGATTLAVVAGTLIEKIIVKQPTPLVAFTIGTTLGGDDLYGPQAPATVIAQDMYFDADTTIYFGGVAGDTVLTIYKR